MAMRSSASLSKILILTKAVWGLAAEMGGLLILLDAVGCERVWEDKLGELRYDESTEAVDAW